MELRRLFFIALVSMVALVTGCNKQGIQGGDLKNKFTGVEAAKALSPTTIQLNWSLDNRYNSFKVYMGGSDKPIKTETFSQSLINDLVPGTEYSFTVTGIKSDGTGAEEGFSNSYVGKTLPSFSGIKSEMITERTKNSVRFKFVPSSDAVTYQLFSKIRNADWNFANPIDQGSSPSEVILSANGLVGGTTYCFYIVAKYLDGTSEPKTDVAANVDSKAVCEATENSIPPANVTMNSIVPGEYPWFNVSGGADANTKVEIRRISNDQIIASRLGTGELRASVPVEFGPEQFYSITSTAFGIASSAINLLPEPTGERAGKAYLRNIASDKNDPKGPIFPELINGGKGIQRFGSKVVTGDFNCDGLPDVAVSAPDATPFGDPAEPNIDENHYIKTGAVIVYYGKEQDVLDSSGVKIGTNRVLNSSSQPLPTNVAPEPQLMYYPATRSNTLIGSQMAVGNANGDCRSLKLNTLTGKLETQTEMCDTLWSTLGQSGKPDRTQIATCDDLAFSSNEGNGAVYVLYGNPNSGLTNTQGAQPGVNDFACVAGGSCQAMKYTAVGTNFTDVDGDLSKYSSLGKSLSFGDFDNDGFDELAIGATHTSKGVVMVLKGSDSGLYPPVFNSIPTVAFFNKNGSKLSVVYEAAANFEDPSFGFSVAAVPDSRLCSGLDTDVYPNVIRNLFPDDPNRLAKQDYDFSKCDDLVIGAPNVSSNRGSIFSCAGVLNSSYQIGKWVCQEHRPNNGSSNDQYGYSLLGMKNLNSYPMGSSRTSQPADVTGALAVGAPGRSGGIGEVYVYYVTPYDAAEKATNQASGTGGIQRVLSDIGSTINITSGAATATITHSIEAIDSTACDYTNQNRVTATPVRWALNPTTGTIVSSCDRQSISMQPSLANARFGSALSLLPDMSANDSNRFLLYSGAPMLAVSAPNAAVPSVLNSSINILEHGMVKIYQLDVSEAVAASGGTSSYPFRRSSNSTYYFGNGINPYGSVTISPADLTPKSQFGKGGVAGGYFYTESAPSLIQVIGGADGRTVGSAILNGSLSVFKAKTKQLTYIEQKCSSACGSGISNLEVAPNVSIETSYHFEMAQVGGDFNGDGFEDVVSRSILGDRVRVVVYYGSSTGLVRTPSPSRLAVGLEPLLLEFDADPEMGMKFSRVGSVNGDAFDDLLLVGAQGAYVYYGSFAGLVANSDPSTAPNGTYPLWFGRNVSSPAIYLYASATGSNINGSTLASDFEASRYNQGNDGITAGDYNGDGSFDIAFSVNEAGNETVLVVFGELNKGLQVNRITNPGRFVTADLLDWNGTKSTNASTCNVVDAALQPNSHCIDFGSSSSTLVSGKALRIRSPKTWGSGQIEFGRKLTSLKPDSSIDSSSYTNKTWSLVVADRIVSSTVNQSSLYTFAVVGNSMKTSGAFPALTLKSDNSYAFMNVTRIANGGDVNRDKVPDLLVSSDNDAQFSGLSVRMIYGKTGSLVTFSTHIDDKPKIATMTEVIPFLQGTDSSQSNYGFGIGSVGDFNGDGFDDIFINVPKGDNVSSTATLVDTGYVIVVFGSSTGIRIKSGTVYSTPSATPKCYGGTDEHSVCEPYLVFLPEAKDNEYTYISEKSVGDINGDGIPDILIGGYGRDNVNGKGYATGVVYVLY